MIKLLKVISCISFLTLASASYAATDCSPYDEWSSTKMYKGSSDPVTFNKKLYQANWWNFNEVPSENSDPWEAWSFVDTCKIAQVISCPDWTLGVPYNQDDRVTHFGRFFICRAGGLCGIGGAYEPVVGRAWVYAWDEMSSCN